MPHPRRRVGHVFPLPTADSERRGVRSESHTTRRSGLLPHWQQPAPAHNGFAPVSRGEIVSVQSARLRRAKRILSCHDVVVSAVLCDRGRGNACVNRKAPSTILSRRISKTQSSRFPGKHCRSWPHLLFRLCNGCNSPAYPLTSTPRRAVCK